MLPSFLAQISFELSLLIIYGGPKYFSHYQRIQILSIVHMWPLAAAAKLLQTERSAVPAQQQLSKRVALNSSWNNIRSGLL